MFVRPNNLASLSQPTDRAAGQARPATTPACAPSSFIVIISTVFWACLANAPETTMMLLPLHRDRTRVARRKSQDSLMEDGKMVPRVEQTVVYIQDKGLMSRNGSGANNTTKLSILLLTPGSRLQLRNVSASNHR